MRILIVIGVIVMAGGFLDSYSRAAYGTGAAVMDKWLGTELSQESPLGLKAPNPETPEDVAADIIKMMQEQHPEVIKNMDRYYNEHPEEFMEMLDSIK